MCENQGSEDAHERVRISSSLLMPIAERIMLRINIIDTKRIYSTYDMYLEVSGIDAIKTLLPEREKITCFSACLYKTFFHVYVSP